MDKRASDEKNGLIVVARLQGRPAIAAHDPAVTIPSSIIKGDSKTGFFINVDQKYFGLLYITQSQKLANEYMLNNEDCALIGTEDDDCYYLAEIHETK
jgi:hypothetical protein